MPHEERIIKIIKCLSFVVCRDENSGLSRKCYLFMNWNFEFYTSFDWCRIILTQNLPRKDTNRRKTEQTT